MRERQAATPTPLKVTARAEVHLDVQVDLVEFLTAHRDVYWTFDQDADYGDYSPAVWERPAMCVDYFLRNSHECYVGTLPGVTEDVFSGDIPNGWEFPWHKGDYAALADQLPWITQEPDGEEAASRPAKTDSHLFQTGTA